MSLFKKNKNTKIKNSYIGFTIVSTIFLSVYSIGILALIGWALLSSFKVGIFAFDDNIFGLPTELNFENYKFVLSNLAVKISTDGPTKKVYFFELLFNSLSIALGCTIVTLIAHASVAYLCAKYPCKYTKLIHALVIFAMVYPQVSALASTMVIIRGLHLYDSYIGMLFMKFSFGGTYFLILYATFKGIAWDYAEAAFMDGASNLTVFIKIMLPMASGTLGTLFILQFIGYWNGYQFNLVYLPSMPTIAYGLYRFSTDPSNYVTVPIQFAASIMLAVPMLLLFIATKEKILGSISIGGLKG